MYRWLVKSELFNFLDSFLSYKRCFRYISSMRRFENKFDPSSFSRINLFFFCDRYHHFSIAFLIYEILNISRNFLKISTDYRSTATQWSLPESRSRLFPESIVGCIHPTCVMVRPLKNVLENFVPVAFQPWKFSSRVLRSSLLPFFFTPFASLFF